jgi:hypothetical protein
MSVHAQPETEAAPTRLRSSSGSTTSGLLQRRCACGGSAGVTGECAGCRKKRLALQTKLAVNEPGDIYEREADRVAEEVLARPAHPTMTTAPPRIQRLSGNASAQVDAAPASVDRALANAGRPLAPVLRQDMEARFGHDFSRVRVHTGADAEQSSRDVNAHAYTVGHNLVFGAGQFRPETPAGRQLIAHELTHALQQGERPAAIQRQPAKPEGKFQFMLGDVEGQQRVMSIYSPSDPADFLEAFEEKGNQLIAAQSTWLSNNLVQLTADVIVKEKRDPFANLDVDTLRSVAARGFDKALAALGVYLASEAATKILNAVHIGEKVLVVGAKAGTKLRTFGGVLAWIGSALLQALIGPVFDKSKELVKQAVLQMAEAVKRINTEALIPKVAASTSQFVKFMAALKAYLLQDDDDAKPKRKAKSESAGVSIGEGDYKMTVAIDTSVEMTEGRRDKIMLDLANVVLGIDAVIPTLQSDMSLYQELAVKAGVFSGKSTRAHAIDSDKPLKATHSEKFRFSRNLPGKTKFRVPKGASVIVESDARYDLDVDTEGMREDIRPPKEYTIELYRVNTSWRKGDRPVGTARQFEVLKTEGAEWPSLDEGEYYVVISKGGNPAFMLEGNVRIEVRERGAVQKK